MIASSLSCVHQPKKQSAKKKTTKTNLRANFKTLAALCAESENKSALRSSTRERSVCVCVCAFIQNKRRRKNVNSIFHSFLAVRNLLIRMRAQNTSKKICRHGECVCVCRAGDENWCWWSKRFMAHAGAFFSSSSFYLLSFYTQITYY